MLNLAARGGAGTRAAPRMSLNSVVTPESVHSSGILDDPEVRSALMELLPDSQKTEQDLRATLHTPQFQQAMASLSAALQVSQVACPQLVERYMMDASED